MTSPPTNSTDVGSILRALEGAGFNTRRGIEATGGDNAFYLELIADFQQDYLDRLDELRRETSMTGRLRFAHDLKAVLRMLGETRIAELAEKWEMALRNGDDTAGQQELICNALDRVSARLAGTGPS